ncbi:FAD-dependent oxidoreductase [Thiothrix nivea]|uniref:FAD-dependent pyridine nucleotide-disulfide oxidoreductase n=1 Tax=Thiothrix nivea (strain ATCC 35100 / DSM 5205 / JP2) TaxID=870187 RepID=A0A656HDZ7_THINJ|nr:FAD-dependent oxidoreductase [Thiothrix nivea]EIJ33660.1 FAD-dependent pyridine nucleotide-disulfide oxidoreductase [Thiothrix nivea DSM 5205]
MEYKCYKCKKCGHIYNELIGDPIFNIPPRTKFSDLPNSWFCSTCGDSRDLFDEYECSQVEDIVDDSIHHGTTHTVIVGAGIAGWSLAERLRSHDPNMTITIFTLDDGDYYYKPSISESISKRKSKTDLVLAHGHDRANLLNVNLYSKTEVLGINRTAKQLITASGKYSYEKLVLSVGASPIKIFPKNIQPYIFFLNNLDQYEVLASNLLNNHKSILVVGAGLVGCEISDDLSRAGHKIWLHDISPRILSKITSEEVSSFIQNKFSKTGVKFILNCSILSIEKNKNNFLVNFSSGKKITCDIIISVVGLKPNIHLAFNTEIATGSGIKVDDYMMTSDPNIWAIGDCIEHAGETAFFIDNIMHQVEIAANAICGRFNKKYKNPDSVITMKAKTCSLEMKTKGIKNYDYKKETLSNNNDYYHINYFIKNKLIGFYKCTTKTITPNAQGSIIHQEDFQC